MAKKRLDSSHLLVAVFLVFVFSISVIAFTPSLTAAATLQRQTDGIPFVLVWALPLILIISAIMFFSYKAICASGVRE